MTKAYDKLDIPNITAESEQGHGCFVKSALSELGFEERFKALKAIELENAKHRSNDSNLPVIKMISSTVWNMHPYTHLALDDNSHSILFDGPALYQDTLDPERGLHWDTCTDLKMDK